MARNKFQTLTEPMYYILLALCETRNGSEITSWVSEITNGRINLAPGTLYALLAQFLQEDIIERTKSKGSGKFYIITDEGRELLEEDRNRIMMMVKDFDKFYKS